VNAELDERGAAPPWEPLPGGLVTLAATVEPGCYRGLEERTAAAGGGAALEVLALAAPPQRAAAAGAGGGANAGADEDEDGGGGADEEGEDEDGAAAAAPRRAAAAPTAAAASAGLAALSLSGGGGGGGGGGASSASDARTAAAALGTGMSVSRAAQPGARLSCASCCGVRFADAAEHRAHFRSDWHRYNLKLKTRGAPAADAAAFAALPPGAAQLVLDALE